MIVSSVKYILLPWMKVIKTNSEEFDHPLSWQWRNLSGNWGLSKVGDRFFRYDSVNKVKYNEETKQFYYD